jgi:hypothetical protein
MHLPTYLLFFCLCMYYVLVYVHFCSNKRYIYIELEKTFNHSTQDQQLLNHSCRVSIKVIGVCLFTNLIKSTWWFVVSMTNHHDQSVAHKLTVLQPLTSQLTNFQTVFVA